MPKIVFEANRLGLRKEVDAAKGGSLADLCDEVLAPVPFSCRSASCGICQVEVLEGAELLGAAEPDEVELLEFIGAGPTHRLACQAVVGSGPGCLRVVPVLED